MPRSRLHRLRSDPDAAERRFIPRVTVLIVGACQVLLAASTAGAFEQPVKDRAVSAPYRARAITRALLQAVIRTEISAPVITIGFREGENFKKGDLLVEFDCRRYEAEHRMALAEVAAADVQLKANVKAERHGALSNTQLEISRAQSQKAKAKADAVALQIAKCRIEAPFDGRVLDLSINRFELPSPAAALLEIVAVDPLEVELIVPSHWLLWLGPGKEFNYRVDETRRTYRVVVERIDAKVDHLSQTIRVYGSFRTPPEGVLPGMSGTASFPEPMPAWRAGRLSP